MKIRKLTTVLEMLPQLELIQLLSPGLKADEYANMLADMVPHHYYQVIIELDDEPIAVSGYWIATKLYSGKYLEIDNFVVSPIYRNKGVGKKLLDWMTAEARVLGCATLMLDAYVENFSAHHFYYREGFIARGFHYLKPL